MSKGPLHSTSESDIEYWAKKLFGKRYESLTDDQADTCMAMMIDFLLDWQREMERLAEGAV